MRTMLVNLRGECWKSLRQECMHECAKWAQRACFLLMSWKHLCFFVAPAADDVSRSCHALKDTFPYRICCTLGGNSLTHSSTVDNTSSKRFTKGETTHSSESFTPRTDEFSAWWGKRMRWVKEKWWKVCLVPSSVHLYERQESRGGRWALEYAQVVRIFDESHRHRETWLGRHLCFSFSTGRECARRSSSTCFCWLFIFVCFPYSFSKAARGVPFQKNKVGGRFFRSRAFLLCIFLAVKW